MLLLFLGGVHQRLLVKLARLRTQGSESRVVHININLTGEQVTGWSCSRGSGSVFRDGEQEMLEDILLSEPPQSKILLALLSGGFICAGALLVCWLSGSSPTGTVSIVPDPSYMQLAVRLSCPAW